MLMYVVVFILIGAAFMFLWKPQLKLDGMRKTLPAPIACPACGNFYAPGGATGPGAIVRCTSCNVYAQLDATSTAVAIPADFIAQSHAFHTYLPEAPKWPSRCCLCSEPATKREQMQITYAAEPTAEEKLTAQAVVAVASLGTMRVKEHHVNVTERYGVPHCDQHAGGAKLVPMGVAFRSYGYYQQFVNANRANIGA